MNIKFVCNQQRTWFFVHRRTSSLFAINNERDYPCPTPPTPPPQPPLNPYGLRGIKYTWMRYSIGGSAIKVAREQGDGAWNKVHHPPNNMFFHVFSSSTKQHHPGLQSTTNVINPPTPFPNKFIIHWRTSSVLIINKTEYVHRNIEKVWIAWDGESSDSIKISSKAFQIDQLRRVACTSLLLPGHRPSRLLGPSLGESFLQLGRSAGHQRWS